MNEPPAVNSLRDRYTRLEVQRRDAVKTNEATSGNIEEVASMEVLLDDSSL